jgi:hypothetical protein
MIVVQLQYQCHHNTYYPKYKMNRIYNLSCSLSNVLIFVSKAGAHPRGECLKGALLSQSLALLSYISLG